MTGGPVPGPASPAGPNLLSALASSAPSAAPGPPAPPQRTEGTLVSLELPGPSTLDDLTRLDWLRWQRPEMGGWSRRQPPMAPWATQLFRSNVSGRVVGVLDAFALSGYPGVVNVSIFTDTAVASPGVAIDAYGLFVGMLFDRGIRLVHHEVLEFNRPILRILRGIHVEPSARYREHAYVAGRFWDVLLFSFDRGHLQGVLHQFRHRRVARPPKVHRAVATPMPIEEIPLWQ